MGVQDARWRQDMLTLMSAQRHHCSTGIQDARHSAGHVNTYVSTRHHCSTGIQDARTVQCLLSTRFIGICVKSV